MRRCQHCTREYQLHTEGGTKFCYLCVSEGVYQRNYRKPKPQWTCLRCGSEWTQDKTGTPPKFSFCPRCCQHPVYLVLSGSLARHNVSLEMTLAVIEWPYCANEQCGDWLLRRESYSRGGGRGRVWRYNCVVDHDHSCCPGSYSCGVCVRGVICRACNNAMPHSLDVGRAKGILNYLVAYGGSSDQRTAVHRAVDR